MREFTRIHYSIGSKKYGLYSNIEKSEVWRLERAQVVKDTGCSDKRTGLQIPTCGTAHNSSSKGPGDILGHLHIHVHRLTRHRLTKAHINTWAILRMHTHTQIIL